MSSTDITALENVLTKLALTTDEARLQTVLAKLLPKLVGMLSPTDSPVRRKTLEVLGAVAKRVRSAKTVLAGLEAQQETSDVHECLTWGRQPGNNARQSGVPE